MEEATAILASTHRNVSLQPGPSGAFDIALQSDFSKGMHMHRLSTSTGVTFKFKDQYDGYMLAALDAGALEVDIDRQRIERRAASCLMIDPMLATTSRWHPGQYELLLVDGHQLNKRLSALAEIPVLRRVQFRLDVAVNAHGVRISREIAKIARMCFAGPHVVPRAEETLHSLRDALISTLLTQIPNNYSSRLARQPARPSPRHVRRAIEYIHANAMVAITIDDIAEVAHVSIRSLQAGFSRFKGMAPMAYLKHVRLEGARAELSLAGEDGSIAEIAKRWRFGHLGVFARDYRRAFGELPSETRKMAKNQG